MRVTLITGRTLKQGMMVEGEKSKMKDELNFCEMNPDDMRENNLQDNDEIKLISGNNEITFKAINNKDIPKGLVFCPISPQINKLIPYSRSRRGILSGKGIIIEIKKAI